MRGRAARAVSYIGHVRREIDEAQLIVNDLLGALQSGDALAVAIERLARRSGGVRALLPRARSATVVAEMRHGIGVSHKLSRMT